MNLMSKCSGIHRSAGDPSIVQGGPSSKGLAEHAVRSLGWFSVGLGVIELIGPEQIAKALGMEGKETLIRAYGARELAAGRLCLSVDKTKGAWSRVAGDLVDIATLLTAFNDKNPKKRNVGIAIAAVAGITLLDLVAAQALTVRHSRSASQTRSFADRSGFPQGAQKAKGAATRAAAGSSSRATPRNGAVEPTAQQLQQYRSIRQ
jgi:hypothetical protein